MAAIFYRVVAASGAAAAGVFRQVGARASATWDSACVVARALAGGLPPRITRRQARHRFRARVALRDHATNSISGSCRDAPPTSPTGTPIRSARRSRLIALLGVGYNFGSQQAVGSWQPPMTFDNLLLERDGAVAILTINRPAVLNALDTPTTDELRRAVLDLKHDASVRVVIVTGAGEKSFIAGADINELAALTPTQGKEHAQRGQHVFDLIENMGKPVIAADQRLLRSAAAASWRWRARCASRPTPRESVSPRSTSASFPVTPARSASRGSSAKGVGARSPADRTADQGRRSARDRSGQQGGARLRS